MAEFSDRIESFPSDPQYWVDLTKRLLVYALWQVRQYRWQGQRGIWKDVKDCILPGGVSLEDLVNQAIEKTLSGARHWNPEISMFQHLKGVVRSDISTILDGLVNKREIRESALAKENEEGEALPPPSETVPSTSLGPSEFLLEKENEDFFWEFYESLKGEPKLQKIVECMMDGLPGPAEWAAAMGTTAPDIYNEQKKLLRRATEFYKLQVQKESARKGGVES